MSTSVKRESGKNNPGGIYYHRGSVFKELPEMESVMFNRVTISIQVSP